MVGFDFCIDETFGLNDFFFIMFNRNDFLRRIVFPVLQYVSVACGVFSYSCASSR